MAENTSPIVNPTITEKEYQAASSKTVQPLQESYNYAQVFGSEFVNRLQQEGNFKPHLGLDLTKLYEQSIKAEKQAIYDSQSTADSVFNFFAQSVADIVGGTLEGAGYILDVPGWASAIFGDGSEMGNWLSDFGKETIKKGAEEYFPLYENPDGNYDLNKFLTGAKSVVSSLSLLIPAAGLSRGVGYLGKGMGMVKGMQKTAKVLGASEGAIKAIPELTNGLRTIAFSRHAENMMEASDTYDKIKEERKYQINEKTGKFFTDEEADTDAREASKEVYLKNWSMILQDIPQYYLMLRGINPRIRQVERSLGMSSVQREVNRWGGFTAATASEGAEEAFQFIIGEDAKYHSDLKRGLVEEKEFGERMSEYLKDENLWEAAAFGALGGAVFQGIGPSIEKKFNTYYSNKLYERAIRNDIAGMEFTQNIVKGNFVSDNVANDKLYASRLKDLEEVSNNPNSSSVEKQNATEVIGLLNKYKSKYDDTLRATGSAVAAQTVVDNDLQSRAYEASINRSLESVATSIKELPLYNNLSSIGKERLGLQAQEKGLKQALEVINSANTSKAFKFSEESTQNLNSKLSEVQNKLKELTDAYSDKIQKTDDNEILKVTDLTSLRSHFSRINLSIQKQIELQKDTQDILSNKKKREEAETKSESVKTESKQKASETYKKADGTSIINELSKPEVNSKDVLAVIKQEKSKPEGERNNSLIGELAKLANSKQAAEKRQASVEAALYPKLLAIATKLEASGEQTFTKEQEDLMIKYAAKIEEIRNKVSGKASTKETVEREKEDISDPFSGYTDEGYSDEVLNEVSSEELDNAKTEKAHIDSEIKSDEVVTDSPISILDNSDSLTELFATEYINTASGIFSSNNQFQFEQDENGNYKKYKNNKGEVVGGSIVKLEDGFPVSTGQETEFNFKVLNDPDLVYAGKELRLFVPVEDEYNQELLEDSPSTFWADFKVYIQVKDHNGTWTTVSQLEAFKEAVENTALSPERKLEVKKLKELRLHIRRNYETKNEFFSRVEKVLPTYSNRLYEADNSTVKTFNAEEIFPNKQFVFAISTENKSVVHPVTGDVLRSNTSNSGALYMIVPTKQGDLAQYARTRLLNSEEISWLIANRKRMATEFELFRDEASNLIYMQNGQIDTARGLEYLDKIPEAELKDILSKTYFNVRKDNINTKGVYKHVDGKSYKNYNNFLISTNTVTLELNPNQPFYGTKIKLEGLLSQNSVNEIIQNSIDIQEPDEDDFKAMTFKLGKKLESIEQEKAWLQQRLPKVPVSDLGVFRELTGVDNPEVIGVFYNAAIYLSEAAERGTGYHEAFHAVFRLYLSDKEREDLYNEVTQETGIRNKLAIEEWLADKFQDYVLSQEASKPVGKIGSFISRLWNFVKGLLGMKASYNQIFNRINKGEFRQNPIQRNVDKFKDQRADKIDPRVINPITKRERVKAIDYRMFSALRNLVNEGKINSITDASTKLVDTIYSDIKNKYIADSKKPGREELQKVVDNWSDFVSLSKESLQRYGYNLGAEDIYTHLENEDEAQEQESKEKIYSKAFFEEDPRSSISKEMRLFINFIPRVDADGNYVRNSVKDLVFEDGDLLFSFIKRNLSGLETLDNMIERLKVLSEMEPSLNIIIQSLEAGSEQFRNQFKTAFTSQTLKFITVTNDGYEGSRSFKIFTTNRQSIEEEIKSEWAGNHADRRKNSVAYLDDSTGRLVINKEKANALLDEYKDVVSKSKTFTNQTAAHVSDVLKRVGIIISPKSLILESKVNKNFFNSYITGTKSIETLLTSLAKGSDIFSLQLDETDIKGEGNILTRLSIIEANGRLDATVGSFMNGEGKMVYSLNMNTAISKALNRAKNESSYQDFFNEMLTDPYLSSDGTSETLSPFIKVLSQEDVRGKQAREEFEWFVFDTERREESGQSGTAYDSINDKLWIRTTANAILNNGNKYGLFSSPTPADKSNTYFYKFEKEEFYQDNLGTIAGKSFNNLYNLFLREYSSVKKAINEAKALSEEKKVLNIHTGRGLQFNIFKEFNRGGKYDLFSEETPTTAGNEENIKQGIIEWFNNEVQSYTTLLINNDIVSEVKGSLVNKELDVAGTSKFKNDYTKAIKYIVYNQILGYDAITSLTTGNPGAFKSDIDYVKRFGLWQTPGTEVDNNRTIRVAAIYDREAGSKNTPEKFTNEARDIYNQLVSALESVGVKDATSLLKKHAEVNQTDGQGYTTLARHVQNMKDQGTWGKDEERALSDLEKGTIDPKDFIKLVQEKGLHAGTRTHETGRRIPTVIKYSTIPLIPALTKNFPLLEQLRLRMEDVNSPIDELVYSSAFKIGGEQVGSLDKLEDLHIVNIPASIFRIPQIVPIKEKAEANFGSQPARNILSNINPETIYKVHKDEKNGRELIEEYSTLLSANIFDDYNKLSKELKAPNFKQIDKLWEAYKVSTSLQEKEEILNSIKGNKKEINKAIHDILIQEYRKRGNLSENYAKALEINPETGEFEMPLDFPPFVRKWENIIFSLFDKRVIKKSMPGQLAVNVSDYGFTEGEEDLKYIQPIYDDAGKLVEVGYAECYVSQDYFQKVTGKVNIKIEDVPEDLRKIVGYRVPNQGKNSMLHMKIKGFLPANTAQAIVGPKNLTVQAGLDFDIDKLFLMIPHFNKRLERVKYVSNPDKTRERYNEYKKERLLLKKAKTIFDQFKVKGSDEVIENIINSTEELKEELQRIFGGSFEDYIHDILVEEGDALSLEEFEQLSIPEQNTRRARENRIIDIFTSVLSNPAHINELITPNSSSTLEAIIKKYELASSNSSQNYYSFAFHNSQRALNKAAKQLVGVYSNHVVALPIMQIFKPKVKDIIFEFGNKKYSELGQVFDSEGNLITNNMAELQTAAVDNAKDPLLGYLNDNAFIAPIRATMTAFGVPLETSAIFFIQPVIKEFTEKWSSYGSTKNAAEEAYKELKEKYREDEVQSSELERLMQYSDFAREYDNAVKSLRADSKGVGPTTSNNEVFRNKVEKTLSEGKVDISGILSKSSIGFIRDYNRYGIGESLRYSQNLFIFNKQPFKGVKEEIANKLSIELSEEIIDLVNYHLYAYLFTGEGSIFNISKEEEKALLTGTQSIMARWNSFIESERSNMSKDVNYEYNRLIDFLKPTRDNIDFNNTSGGLTAVQKSALQEEFFRLYTTDSKLATDMVKYLFLSSGFQKASKSFMDLIPVELWVELGLNEYYKEVRKNQNIDPESFIDQFLRNNYSRDVLVPRIKTVQNKIEDPGVQQVSDTMFKVYTNNKKFSIIKNHKPSFKPYIKLVKGKKDVSLYRLEGIVKDDSGTHGVYVKTTTLGDTRRLQYSMTQDLSNPVIFNTTEEEFIPLDIERDFEIEKQFSEISVEDSFMDSGELGIIEPSVEDVSANKSVTNNVVSWYKENFTSLGDEQVAMLKALNINSIEDIEQLDMTEEMAGNLIKIKCL